LVNNLTLQKKIKRCKLENYKYYTARPSYSWFCPRLLNLFYPVLQGKQIYQSDIAQYTGMAKEQNDFRAAEDVEPYWTNSLWGTDLSIRANYPYDLHRAMMHYDFTAPS
jgi:hypothetical protein